MHMINNILRKIPIIVISAMCMLGVSGCGDTQGERAASGGAIGAWRSSLLREGRRAKRQHRRDRDC